MSKMTPDEIKALAAAVKDRVTALDGKLIVAKSRMESAPEGVAEELAALRSAVDKLHALLAAEEATR